MPITLRRPSAPSVEFYPIGSTLPDWTLQIDTVRIGPGTPFIVQGVNGLGIADVRTNDTPRASSPGDFMGTDTAGSKTLSIDVTVTGTTPEETLDNYDALVGAWQLAEDEDIRPLMLKLPGRETLYIPGRPRRAAPTDGFASLKSRRVDVSLEYYSPDAAVYSADLTTESTGLPVAATVSYPLVYPWSYPASDDGVVRVTNRGNFSVPCLFQFYGSVVNPRVVHRQSGRFLAFATTVASGDWLEADTGAKTVKLNGTAGRRATLVAGSKWITIRKGDNDFLFTAESGDVSTARLYVTARSGYAG